MIVILSQAVRELYSQILCANFLYFRHFTGISINPPCILRKNLIHCRGDYFPSILLCAFDFSRFSHVSSSYEDRMFPRSRQPVNFSRARKNSRKKISSPGRRRHTPTVWMIRSLGARCQKSFLDLSIHFAPRGYHSETARRAHFSMSMRIVFFAGMSSRS